MRTFQTIYSFKNTAKTLLDSKYNTFSYNNLTVNYDGEHVSRQKVVDAINSRIRSEQHRLDITACVIAGSIATGGDNPVYIEDFEDLDQVIDQQGQDDYHAYITSLYELGKTVLSDFATGNPNEETIERLKELTVVDKNGVSKTISVEQNRDYGLMVSIETKNLEERIGNISDKSFDIETLDTLRYRYTDEAHDMTLTEWLRHPTLGPSISKDPSIMDTFALRPEFEKREVKAKGLVKTAADLKERNFDLIATYFKPEFVQSEIIKLTEPTYMISPNDSLVGRLFNVVIGKRVKENADAIYNWLDNQSVDVTKPFVLCLDGNGDEHPKRANGFAKQIQEYFSRNVDVSDVSFYSAYYEGHSDELCRAVYKFLEAEINADEITRSNSAGVEAVKGYMRTMEGLIPKYKEAAEHASSIKNNQIVIDMLSNVQSFIKNKTDEEIIAEANNTSMSEKEALSLGRLSYMINLAGNCPSPLGTFKDTYTTALKNYLSRANVTELMELNPVDNVAGLFKGMSAEDIKQTRMKTNLMKIICNKISDINNPNIVEMIKTCKTESLAYEAGDLACKEFLERKDELVDRFRDTFGKIFCDSNGRRNVEDAERLARNVNLFGFCYGTQIANMLCRGLEYLSREAGFSREETKQIMKQVHAVQMSPRVYEMGFEVEDIPETVYYVKSLNDHVALKSFVETESKYISDNLKTSDPRCKDFCVVANKTDSHGAPTNKTLVVANFSLALAKRINDSRVYLPYTGRVASRSNFEHYEQTYISDNTTICPVNKREDSDQSGTTKKLAEMALEQGKKSHEIVREAQNEISINPLDNTIRPLGDRLDPLSTTFDYTASKLRDKVATEKFDTSLQYGVFMNESIKQIMTSIIESSKETYTTRVLATVNEENLNNNLIELMETYNTSYREHVVEEDHTASAKQVATYFGIPHQVEIPSIPIPNVDIAPEPTIP